MWPYDVSIIVPVRNDIAALTHLLGALQRWADRRLEIIVVDGESDDGSADLARRMGARVLSSRPGRGLQLNTGVQAAQGEWIWMLHADSRVSLPALTYIRSRRTPAWGRFAVSFEPTGMGMRLIALAMNTRSRLTGICTGDQGIFCHRAYLRAVGGVPEIPLMEDVELTRRLNRLGSPLCPGIPVVTSSRRWQRRGLLATVLGMWRLRLLYWAGAEADDLARTYYG